jgi:hypothetical protein
VSALPEAVSGFVSAVDGAEEAASDLQIPTAARRREIERFEPLRRFSTERAARVGVDEVVFHGAQPQRELVVGDAQLVEPRGLLIRKKPQQVANQLLVVGL